MSAMEPSIIQAICLLFVVGPVDVEQTMKQIKDNQNKKKFNTVPEIKRQFPNEPRCSCREKTSTTNECSNLKMSCRHKSKSG